MEQSAAGHQGVGRQPGGGEGVPMPSKLPVPGCAGVVIPTLSKACSSETDPDATAVCEAPATIARPRTAAATAARNRQRRAQPMVTPPNPHSARSDASPSHRQCRVRIGYGLRGVKSRRGDLDCKFAGRAIRRGHRQDPIALTGPTSQSSLQFSMAATGADTAMLSHCEAPPCASEFTVLTSWGCGRRTAQGSSWMRIRLPAGSRKAQSRIPYGCWVGSWTTSAPRRFRVPDNHYRCYQDQVSPLPTPLVI